MFEGTTLSERCKAAATLCCRENLIIWRWSNHDYDGRVHHIWWMTNASEVYRQDMYATGKYAISMLILYSPIGKHNAIFMKYVYKYYVTYDNMRENNGNVTVILYTLKKLFCNHVQFVSWQLELTVTCLFVLS